MDESMLLNGVLRSVLGGRRKRSRGAMGYLGNSRSPFGGTLGSIGGSLLSNPNLLLAAAGVAWGIFETLQEGNAPAASSPVSNATQTPPLPPLPVVGNPSAPMSDDEFFGGTRLVRTADTPQARSPFVVVRADRRVIADHTDIWSRPFVEFMAALITRTDALLPR